MFKRLRASIRDGFARAFPMVDPFMMVGPDPGQYSVSVKTVDKPSEDLAGRGEPPSVWIRRAIMANLKGEADGVDEAVAVIVSNLEASPPAPSWPAEKDRIVKWLKAAIAASAQSEVDHPKGSSTRLFYGAQLVAYENALGAVLRASPGEAKPGTVEHHRV